MAVTSALVGTLAFAISCIALRIAAAPSNYNLHLDKTENLDGELEIYEDLEEEKEITKTKNKTKKPYEDSSKTQNITENTDEDGYETDISDNVRKDGES